MNKYVILIFFILFSCNKNEEKWDNPYDSRTSPDVWSPKNLSIIQEEFIRIRLSWTQENSNIDGFKIHRRKNSDSWDKPLATLDKYSSEWIDTNFIADPDIVYEYKVYAFAGNNQSSAITGKIRPEAIPNTFKDVRDGQFYKYVEIGNQTWMAENLNYYTSSGSWCANDLDENGEKYGRLYDIQTALYSCPQGWHLPTDEEWKVLERYLGMSETDVNSIGDRFSGDVGLQLQPNYAFNDNPSGFDAQFGGIRSPNGVYYDVGYYAYFWSKERMYRHLIVGNEHVRRDEISLDYGLSVRCIKD